MALTDRNTALYTDYKKGMKPAALGRKYKISRQQASQIINREAENRNEEVRDMTRKKQYGSVLPATTAPDELRLFVDALGIVRDIRVSDVMRYCVETTIDTLDKKEMKRVREVMAELATTN